MIVASLGGGSNPTDDVKRAADKYNTIAAAAAAAGLQQGLHNEGFEVSKVDGQRTYDVLIGLLDPKLVKFQFQMSTISQGFVAHGVLHEVSGPLFLDAHPGHRSECGSAGRGFSAGARTPGRRRQGQHRLGQDVHTRRKPAASGTTSWSRRWS